MVTLAIKAGRIEWRKHVLQRLAERNIDRDHVLAVLLSGEVVETYRDDKPFPSALFLGIVNDRPIHVVASLNEKEQTLYIITTYEPSKFSKPILRPGEKMSRKNKLAPCPMCGGRKEMGTTTFSAELGTGVVVVRNVKATICVQCGEEWIDDLTAQRLEKIVNEARAKQHQVEVLAF